MLKRFNWFQRFLFFSGLIVFIYHWASGFEVNVHANFFGLLAWMLLSLILAIYLVVLIIILIAQLLSKKSIKNEAQNLGLTAIATIPLLLFMFVPWVVSNFALQKFKSIEQKSIYQCVSDNSNRKISLEEPKVGSIIHSYFDYGVGHNQKLTCGEPTDKNPDNVMLECWPVERDHMASVKKEAQLYKIDFYWVNPVGTKQLSATVRCSKKK